MFPIYLLGLVLLVASLLLLRWFVGAEPAQVKRVAFWVAIVLGVVVGGYLLFAGRQLLAALWVPALLAFLWLRPLWQRAKAARGPSSGQTSEVATRFLDMTLDHDSGAMTGTVREGRFAGRRLETLSLDDLIELWQTCMAEDEQSARVLESYLDRTLGDAWREKVSKGQAGGGPGAPMTREEAYEILGLEPGADEAEIRKAYRRLMQKIHPDQGGSGYLAAKINQAKDLLLGS